MSLGNQGGREHSSGVSVRCLPGEALVMIISPSFGKTPSLSNNLIARATTAVADSQISGYLQKPEGMAPEKCPSCLDKPKCLDPQPGLHTSVRVCPGVWIPSWGCTQAFGSPTRVTHKSLDFQPELQMGIGIPGLQKDVWNSKRAILAHTYTQTQIHTHIHIKRIKNI